MARKTFSKALFFQPLTAVGTRSHSAKVRSRVAVLKQSVRSLPTFKHCKICLKHSITPICPICKIRRRQRDEADRREQAILDKLNEILK